MVWVYARGPAVKVDDKQELMVTNAKGKQKSFPIEKVLFGLSKETNVYVLGLLDTFLVTGEAA